jgi:hypothetical protein
MPIIETEIWKKNPEKPGILIFDSQRKARDVFVELKEHLKSDGRLPDEYFLFSETNFGKGALFPRSADIYANVNYGRSEGIYLDVFLKYQKDVYELNQSAKSGEWKKRTVTESFATGKTLGESLADLEKMNSAAASVTAAFYSDGRELRERYARIENGEEQRIYPPRNDKDNSWENRIFEQVTAEEILKTVEKSFGLPANLAQNDDYVLSNHTAADKLYPSDSIIEFREPFEKSDDSRGHKLNLYISYRDEYEANHTDHLGSGVTENDYIIGKELYYSLLKYKPESTGEQFMLPEKAGNNEEIIQYFTETQGIAPNIISGLIKYDKLYQSESGSAVFVAYDGEKNPQSAQEYNFKGEKNIIPQSDISYNFTVFGNANAEKVYVFENPPDSIIQATADKNSGADWKSAHRIALTDFKSSESFDGLKQFIQGNPQITQVTFWSPKDESMYNDFIHAVHDNFRNAEIKSMKDLDIAPAPAKEIESEKVSFDEEPEGF